MSDPRLTNKRFLIAKAETTPGIDSSPTSVNGLYVETLTVKKLDVKTIDRNTIKPFMGSSAKVVATSEGQLDFEIALATGGNAAGVPTPGTTPAYDAVLRGCGMVKTVSATAISATAQGGTLNSIKLDAAASATDDIYCGMTVLAEFQSGVLQAPGVTDQAQIKLPATDNIATGSTVGTSTTTAINLAVTASADDDFYTGMSLIIAGQTRTISAYVGSTKVATVSSAFPSAPAAATAYTILYNDDYYVGMAATVVHFSGTIVSSGSFISTVNYIYLPASLASANILGCDLKITTGAVTEIRRISAYDTVSRKATLASKLATIPTSASTFKVTEIKPIIASNGTTRLVTVKTPYKFLTLVGGAFTLSAYRLVIDYNGTSKIATVTPAFKKAPTTTTVFSFNPFVKYTPSSANHISNTFYYYEDGALHSFIYARGNVSFEFNNNAIPVMKFSYKGLVDRYEDGAFPSFDLSAWVEPLPINYDNTQNLIVNGFADTVMDKISFDLGNELVHLDAPGADMIYIKNRAVKGNVSIWSPLASQVDFYSAIINAQTNQVSFTHGPIGNQISIFCKSVQLLNPSDSEKDGIQMLGMDFNILPTGTGSNDINIILQ